jgi:hypothetical protein
MTVESTPPEQAQSILHPGRYQLADKTSVLNVSNGDISDVPQTETYAQQES